MRDLHINNKKSLEFADFILNGKTPSSLEKEWKTFLKTENTPKFDKTISFRVKDKVPNISGCK